MAHSTDEAQYELALADLAKQDKPNIKATAEKYNVKRTTLYNRWSGKSASRVTANSLYHQCLTNAQESVLIRQINFLTNRGLPPTSRIVRNMAEEIAQRRVGKNWVSEFVKRHEKDLLSRYLQAMDRDRKAAEYAPLFKAFYELVRAFLIIYYI
jgi:predicted GTPase